MSRVWLVTGASSGFGRAITEAAVASGDTVVATARSTARLDDLVTGHPDQVEAVRLDVTDPVGIQAVVKDVVDRYGRIDVLVNNAGIGSAGAIEENSVTQARNVFEINVFGVMRMTKAALPHMRARGSGRIINISSVLGLIPQPYMALYVAAKHAVEGYSESLDHEVREHGVRVLLVEPAYTKTSFDTNAAQPDTPLPVYAQRRRVFDEVIAAAMKVGDAPDVVAKVVVAAATDPKPKLRYTAGPLARRMRTLRRLAPAGTFDKGIRKFNRMPV